MVQKSVSSCNFKVVCKYIILHILFSSLLSHYEPKLNHPTNVLCYFQRSCILSRNIKSQRRLKVFELICEYFGWKKGKAIKQGVSVSWLLLLKTPLKNAWFLLCIKETVFLFVFYFYIQNITFVVELKTVVNSENAQCLNVRLFEQNLFKLYGFISFIYKLKKSVDIN